MSKDNVGFIHIAREVKNNGTQAIPLVTSAGLGPLMPFPEPDTTTATYTSSPDSADQTAVPSPNYAPSTDEGGTLHAPPVTQYTPT